MSNFNKRLETYFIHIQGIDRVYRYETYECESFHDEFLSEGVLADDIHDRIIEIMYETYWAGMTEDEIDNTDLTYSINWEEEDINVSVHI